MIGISIYRYYTMARPKKFDITETEKKRIQMEAFRNSVFEAQQKLVNAQLAVALGTSWLYRVDIDDNGNRKKPVQVTDEQEVQEYLAGMYDKGRAEYYYIFTEKPDTRAIDSLLDRALGKAESVKSAPEEQEDLGVIIYPTSNTEQLEQSEASQNVIDGDEGVNLLSEGGEALDGEAVEVSGVSEGVQGGEGV